MTGLPRRQCGALPGGLAVMMSVQHLPACLQSLLGESSGYHYPGSELHPRASWENPMVDLKNSCTFCLSYHYTFIVLIYK